MSSVRTTITLDGALAAEARRLDINISAAARDGVAAAVRQALAAADRAAYIAHPEGAEDDWEQAEAWGEA